MSFHCDSLVLENKQTTESITAHTDSQKWNTLYTFIKQYKSVKKNRTILFHMIWKRILQLRMYTMQQRNISLFFSLEVRNVNIVKKSTRKLVIGYEVLYKAHILVCTLYYWIFLFYVNKTALSIWFTHLTTHSMPYTFFELWQGTGISLITFLCNSGLLIFPHNRFQ